MDESKETNERLLALVENLTGQCEMLSRMNLELMGVFQATIGLTEGLRARDLVEDDGKPKVYLNGQPVK